ncbi:hypothetical protein MKX03_021941 [Papaver bracteatum]|nr:hypothetical protein MKX03_021941 [Papaver bracteatum]
MGMNVEKSGKKMSFIFVTACFVGINSAFLIGYTFGITVLNTYNLSVPIYGILVCSIPTSIYIGGICAVHVRKKDYRRLYMRTDIIWSGALVSMGSVGRVLTIDDYTRAICVAMGTMMYGSGFGLMYQGAPACMFEMGFSHRNYLASLNIAFKIMMAIGVFVENLVNCSTNSMKDGWGWKISICIVVIPTAIISIGSFLLPDTSMSMIKLGSSWHFDDAKKLLQRLHGTNDNLHILFKDLLSDNKASKSAKGFEKQIMSQTHNKLVCTITLHLFQKLTGMNVILLYAPYLFQVVGFKTSVSLTYTAIVGGVNVAATIIGVISVSQNCGRFFLISGEVQLFSWGPLGWIFLSSEDDMLPLYLLEVRSCCQHLASEVHWKLSSFITVEFPVMECLFKFYILYLLDFFGVIMTFHAYYFMPNIDRLLIEEYVSKVWKQHWYWRMYFVDLENDDIEEDVSEVWKQHWFWGKYYVDNDPIDGLIITS